MENSVLHTLEERSDGQLEAGFMLLHLYEDTNGAGNLHEHNIPTLSEMELTQHPSDHLAVLFIDHELIDQDSHIILDNPFAL